MASTGTFLSCDSPSSSAAFTPLNSDEACSATSHLLSAMTSALPSSTTRSAMRRSCASSPRVASSSRTTTSACSIERRASAPESFSSLSSTLARFLKPAVSTSRTGRPCHSQSSVIESRVMPASGPVIIRSSPSIRFTSVDLPAFGRPDDRELQRPVGIFFVLALRRPSSSSRSTNGRRLSNRSTTPSPCSALIAIGSPSPRA